MKRKFKCIVSFLTAIFIVLRLVSCSGPGPISNNESTSLPDVIEQTVLPETVLPETVLPEHVIQQIISEEIYIKELVVAEQKISQQLIQEEKIEEVLMCKNIYIPEKHIKDFANNSQADRIFGEGIDIEPLLTKISVGTGIILTLAVLSILHIEGAVGAIIASAAPAALEGALMGAGVGTVIGGLTGACDEIDETRRTSSIIGFSVAVAGFIIATVSAILAFPSGGSTAAAVAFGIKVAIAGMSLAGAGYAGYEMVKTLTTTNKADIDWNNIDWNKVGISSAEQAINGAANGYVWGSVIGAVEGGLNGYTHYEKHGAPYSSYKDRLSHTPKEGRGGHWSGKRGESKFILDDPIKCKNGMVVKEISYKNGIPDFSNYSIRQVKISQMTNNRASNFRQADELLSEYWSKIKFEGKTWNPRDVANYRTNNGLTWHEMNNMETMQLVPTEVNGTWGHLGGVGEYNTMIGNSGGTDFD